MTPFYLFAGTLIIYIFKSQINLSRLKNFTTVFWILFLISPFIYAYVSIIKTDKRTDFPGKEKAEKIQSDWNKKYKSEIEYVVGDEWYGGNLSYHLESRPKWISINDEKAYELIKSKDRMSGTMSLENTYPALIIGNKWKKLKF